jgi:hypothetical protein
LYFRQDIDPEILVIGLCIISFILQFRFIFGSEIAYLAADWMKDDAFYYLQPAWQLKQFGFFTFDGINPTYGFHPLWMIIVAFLAAITSDKVFFFREILLFSSLLYCVAGYMLYRLMHRVMDGLLCIIPSLIWLFNLDLIYVFVSGKESVLFAILLLWVLHLFFEYERSSQSSRGTIVLIGLCSGLLVLTRVNMILFLCLAVGYLLIIPTKVAFKDRILDAMIIVSIAVAVTLPWIVYARLHFGTVFPNSGTQKLIGASAAVAYYFHSVFPFLKLEWLEHFMTDNEKMFLAAPQYLFLPSLSNTLDFFLRYIPVFSYGLGLRKIISTLPQTAKTDITILFYIVFACIIALTILGTFRMDGHVFRCRAQIVQWCDKRKPIVLLFVFAVGNGLLNSLLLPMYIRWSIWYAVPELLSCIILISYYFQAIITLIRKNNVPIPPKLRRLKYFGVLALVVIGTLTLSPKQFHATSEFQDEAWLAHQWMNDNLRTGDRVGAWSSGILGYFSNGPTIINLDGLANSPKYTTEVCRRFKLYLFGLTSENSIWEYIQQNNIRYIADAGFENEFDRHSFLEAIPAEHYQIIYRGAHLIDWHEKKGKRQYVVLKLNY